MGSRPGTATTRNPTRWSPRSNSTSRSTVRVARVARNRDSRIPGGTVLRRPSTHAVRTQGS